MKNPLTTIFSASKIVFTQNSIYWLFFSIFVLLALILFIMVPVLSVPGNDVVFQLSLFTFGNWMLFVVLAMFIALLLTMQVFIFRRAKKAATKAKNLGNAFSGGVGAYSGILAGIFATAACSWCVAAVFGFFGSATVLFIAENKAFAVAVAIIIMLVSLYFASCSVLRECKDCTVKNNKN